MGKGDRRRQVLRGFIGGVTEDHPLIAGANRVEGGVMIGAVTSSPGALIDPLGDIGGLLVKGDEDRAVLGVKPTSVLV